MEASSHYEMSRPYPTVVEHVPTGAVYVSGAGAIDGYGLPATDPRQALELALAAVHGRLASIGLGPSSLLKLTYFVVDMDMRLLIDAQFEEMEEPRPARTVVGAASLPLGALVLIDAVAHR